MYMKFNELQVNEKSSTVALLTMIEEKETKAGCPYCRLHLSDGETQIEANLWNNTKGDVKVPEKTLVTVQLYPKIYKDCLSYEVYQYGPAPEDCRIEDFVVKAPYASADMFDKILFILRKQVPKLDPLQPDLIDLVTDIYNENHDKLLYWSAAKSVHHNCYGGLLYHTYRMLQSGMMLSRVYQVDNELLYAGIALHDIGKLLELETDNLRIADYSVDGTLFGHALLGIEMIQKKVTEKEVSVTYDASAKAYNKEKINLLKHMLCSHHGNLEWGAITVPAIPEAMLLHEIDMIDSRMYQFESELKKLEEGEMSDKVFGLGACVYKPQCEVHNEAD